MSQAGSESLLHVLVPVKYSMAKGILSHVRMEVITIHTANVVVMQSDYVQWSQHGTAQGSVA